jgi:hypothetical protein
MAKFVVTANTVTLNGGTVSPSVARAELVLNSAEVDVTDFGSNGWTEVIGGLKSGTVSLDFHSDFGVGAVSALFQDLVGTIGTVTIGHDSSLYCNSANQLLHPSFGCSGRPKHLLGVVPNHGSSNLRNSVVRNRNAIQPSNSVRRQN